MHTSVACIRNPEFINLQPLDINPLMSSCEIKVLYIGENRNRSVISKAVATEMAKTLRGSPIVGWYNENKEDFMDHGDQIIIDGDGIKFKSLTQPYGFVSPDAKVWFQFFEDTDDFGNVVEREYLMTTGYLWTGQFPECKVVTEEGRPHSMELDPDTCKGTWSTNQKTQIEFFIVNDAIFSKLCILGEDVEPCFEGSSITEPEISTSFTLVDDTFKETLYSMMQDLKFALEGGKNMNNEEKIVQEEVVSIENNLDNFEQNDNNENQNTVTEIAVAEDAAEPVAEEPSVEIEFAKEDEDDDTNDHKDEDEDEDEKQKYAALESEHQTLQAQYADLEQKYSSLEAEHQELLAFKQQVEDAKKDDMINSFSMLSDEDKQEVIQNKSKYSLDEIESKLSVICVRNKVNFTAEETTTTQPVVTFNLDNAASHTPAWIAACEKTQNNRKH